MGKKPSAKKKGKQIDLRGYATTSIASVKKDADAEVVKEAAAAGEDDVAEPSVENPPNGDDAQASLNGNKDGEGADKAAEKEEEEEEEWERAGQDDEAATGTNEQAAGRVPGKTGAGSGPGQGENEMDDEEWEKALESRLDDELQKCLDRRFVPVDATAQFERRSTFAPAGVVVLSAAAEQRVEAALATQRDGAEGGIVRPVFPRHWRYKGKLTWERVNGIYLALESLQFKGEQIRMAMEKTVGFDVRAALEYLFVNLPKVELPRSFGGEGMGDVTESQQPEQQEQAPAAAGVATAAPTTVVEAPSQTKDAPSPPEAPEAQKSTAAQPTPGSAGAQAGAKGGKDEGEKDFNKRWAAQYACGGDSDSDELLDEEEKLDRERRKDPTARYIKISKQCEDLVKVLKALKEKKKQGAFKQNISADMEKQRTANAKMAKLRAEMEALEANRYGKLNRERIANQKAATPAPPPASTAKEAESPPEPSEPAQTSAADADDAAEDEMPSLFDDEQDPAATAEASTADNLPPCRIYNIAEWKSKTPRQALEEFARKRIWGKSPPDKVALYEKLPHATPGRHYTKVTMPQPRNRPTQVFAPDEPCATVRDADNLAAMWAFYNLAEEHDRAEFTRNLPPSFKQRMQEWIEEAIARLRESRRELVRSRVTFVSELLRNKPQPAQFAALSVAEAASTQPTGGRRLAIGEDDESFEELGAEAAARLRADFGRRREAAFEHSDFAMIQEQRASLPVAEYREKLIRSIKCSGVLIVSGATGSGKTTQVPQFVLEDALAEDSNESMPNIIVTEPRRISAVSVAQRVSQEMGDPPGGPGSRGALVGYQIRLEKKATSSTRLLFCTVGVLLKQLQQGVGAISRVTHIFIDEVHERSADCDLLLLLLRQVRYTRPELRVVLMSATLEVKKLVRYFGNSVPVVDVPGRTFPVSAYWLEDIIEMTGYECGEESEFAKRGWGKDWSQKQTFQVSGQKGKTEKITAYVDDEDDWACDDEAESCDVQRYHPETCKALARMDHTRINYQLITALLEYIEQSSHFDDIAPDDGAVLIFLPGLGEISRMHEWINRSHVLNDQKRFLVISLHSVLSGDDHARAFLKPPRGMRKIVLSTNIAETGVTIPDVVFVIDAGKVKQQQYHEPSNTSSLKEKFVSRAEVMQRRGRAGRVREGFSFHLLTERRFHLRLQEMPTPEILRCSLMELMLSVLSSGLQPSCFLEALDPPPRARIDQAVNTLRAVGAVEEGQRPANALQIGTMADDTWFVATPIGLCLSRLPCDVRLGKMVLLSALFGGVDPVVTIAATLSHRSPLATPFSDAKRAQAKHTHCAELLAKDSPPSDHFAVNTAYVRWEEARKGKAVDSFCRKSWLNGQVLQTIREIRHDFQDSLKSEGFCEKYEKDEVEPSEIRSKETVAAILFAGLYPNVARVDAPKNATDKVPAFWAGSEQIKLHPGSLCGGSVEGLHRTNQRWICYHTKLKTSQVFLRDCTFLPPNALLLFGGDTASLNIHPVEKSVSIGLGAERHWHTFYAAPRAVALIRQLRYAFDAVLRRKASDPRTPLSREDRLVIAGYIAVINSVETP